MLDTDTVIHIINPKVSRRAKDCLAWFAKRRGEGAAFYIPAFAWYEALRGAIANSLRGDKRQEKALRELRRSDRVTVLTVQDRVLASAARIWAKASNSGRTPDDKRVSGDTLVVAEAQGLSLPKGFEKVIVSDNYRHLAPLGYLPARPFSVL